MPTIDTCEHVSVAVWYNTEKDKCEKLLRRVFWMRMI